MSFTRFALGEKPSFSFVFKHCYIEGTMSGYDKQLILIIFWTFQGLEFSFVNSRIFKDRGSPVIFPGPKKYFVITGTSLRRGSLYRGSSVFTEGGCYRGLSSSCTGISFGTSTIIWYIFPISPPPLFPKEKGKISDSPFLCCSSFV